MLGSSSCNYSTQYPTQTQLEENPWRTRQVAHMDKKTKITTANGFAYLSKNQFVVFLEARLMQYDLVITANNSNKEPIIISRS
jgi:hypothetical protein